MTEPYFERLDARRFAPTEHVGGAWTSDEQHVAPALGLLTHLVERDRDARRDDRLALTRLSFDILGLLATTTVSFGPDGHGLTSTVVHDEAGPFGTLAQTLTVRPVARPGWSRRAVRKEGGRVRR